MDESIRRKALAIVDRNRIMTVATLRPDGWPQATIVGYANDGMTLYFLCAMQSQKARNLARDSRVSVTIGADSADPLGIDGISMAAHAEIVETADEISRVSQLLLGKYPEYANFPINRDEIRVFRLAPKVISVLDYSKGFGHADLLEVGKKILIVYYSRTGTTRIVAEHLSHMLGCDLETIAEPADRRGILGYWRSIIEARRQSRPPIAAPGNDPSHYDLVIVGTPVWAWSVASPVRSYLAANRGKLPETAFFCTMGGAGGDRTFDQMEGVLGKAPLVRCAIHARDVTTGAYREKLNPFMTALPPPQNAASL
jgi:flavodoxin